MILTFKIKHGRDFSHELALARKVAEFAIEHRSRSTADVKHIGLKSVIANQVLKKYSYDKKAKTAHNVKLTIPNQGIRVDKISSTIFASCLKLTLPYQFRNDFSKVNQIEVGPEFAYISVSIIEPSAIKTVDYIGVDRNTTGHCLVAGNPKTGKVWKLGKSANHIHKKYMNVRRELQSKGKFKKLKAVKNRERRIVKDTNHKISKRVVEVAKENGCGIKMEELKRIRKTTKSAKSFRYSLNSWSFYQLQMMIEYKAKLLGIPVIYVAPQYTSQECSRCGLIGTRTGKRFKCPNGHVENADVNASFNIALRPPIEDSVSQLHGERDSCKGTTDSPKEAMP
jgi:putative transposase